MVTSNPKNQNSFNSLYLFLNNYFNIILALVLILFLGGAYFFILLPKYNETLSVVKDSITKEKNLFDAQQKKLADLKAISSLYQKINQADLKKFNNVLSDNYVKESLFGEIEDIVNQNGFSVDSIGITRPEKDVSSGAAPQAATTTVPINPNLGEIDISLAISKIDYAGFKNLIKIFESNLRLLDLSQVSFSASADTANLTLRTYYYKKNAQ